MAAVLNYIDGDIANEPVVAELNFLEDADVFEIVLITKEGATMPTTGGGL